MTVLSVFGATETGGIDGKIIPKTGFGVLEFVRVAS
jgi:hypothetical protein